MGTPDNQATTRRHKRDPQQEDQSDATEGKDIADYDLDVDYEGSEPKLSQMLKEKGRLILTQNMQKWRFLMMGPSTRGGCLRNRIRGSCGYRGHEDPRLWPGSSRICTPGLDVAPK